MGRIALIGEAWGVEEAKLRQPFVGPSGRELTRMLSQAGIRRDACLLTNVFNLHPPGNDINELCGPKEAGIPGYPSIGKSRYIRSEYSSELARLGRELNAYRPNVIVLLGNTPMWAMLKKTGITKYRGCCDLAVAVFDRCKVLPTYHPAAVLRDWSLRPTTVLDLVKARKQSEFPDLRYPAREVWIEPTIKDIEDFHAKHIRDFLSVDIETSGNQITCIGFAPRPDLCLVIPFYDERRTSRSYWNTSDDEHDAWRIVKRTLGDGTIRKVFQNGLYDIAFLWRAAGIRVAGAGQDTMLLHHALQPESLKGLGYLGSIYCNERAWKEMRGATKTIKRDE